MTTARRSHYGRNAMAATASALAVATLGGAPAFAQQPAPRIDNNVAIFAALDKVTARIQRLEVPLGSTVKFGALRITPRNCYSRAATEQPKTTTFVEITEMLLDGSENRIFSGWMFAESPGLNALEHPVFDIWLAECAQPRTQTARQPGGQASGKAAPAPAGAEQPAADDGFRRRRPAR
jgi:hypothetical protein